MLNFDVKNLSYDKIYKGILLMSDIDQPTDFQKLCILFHTVLLKNNHISSDIISKETLKINANAFAYEKPCLVKQLKLTNDSEKMCIEVLNNQEDKTKLKLAFNNPIVSKINFDNLAFNG